MKLFIYFFCYQFFTGFLAYTTNGYRDIQSRAKRVVGGSSASGPSEFPWMAMITIKGVYECGGSVIAQYVVLSAAHCFQNVKKTDVKIIVGKYNKDEEDTSETEYSVTDIITPPCYSDKTPHKDDIALIILTERITYNINVTKIDLPFEQETLSTSSQCKIMGWGLTDTSGIEPETLQYAGVTILNDEKCQKFLDLTCKSCPINKTMCTGPDATCSTKKACASTCGGDSGGPLVCEVNDKYVQFGIISFGLDGSCGPKSAYTKVNEYKEWINMNIGRSKRFISNISDLPVCKGILVNKLEYVYLFATTIIIYSIFT